jgi:acetyl esterase/lipase
MPRDIGAWLLTGVAVLLAILMVWLAYNMAAAVSFFSLGGFVGTYALFFPLHLLVLSAVAGVMAFVSRRRQATLAMWAFVGTVALTVATALVPTVRILARAREYHAPVSLGNYLANAAHMNEGHPQTDRSVVFGTAKNGEKLELDAWLTGLPKNGPLRPAIVFIHGGGWVVGNRSGRPEWDRWLNELG